MDIHHKFLDNSGARLSTLSFYALVWIRKCARLPVESEENSYVRPSGDQCSIQIFTPHPEAPAKTVTAEWQAPFRRRQFATNAPTAENVGREFLPPPRSFMPPTSATNQGAARDIGKIGFSPQQNDGLTAGTGPLRKLNGRGKKHEKLHLFFLFCPATITTSWSTVHSNEC